MPKVMIAEYHTQVKVSAELGRGMGGSGLLIFHIQKAVPVLTLYTCNTYYGGLWYLPQSSHRTIVFYPQNTNNLLKL